MSQYYDAAKNAVKKVIFKDSKKKPKK